ncbi:Undecaprenyl-phosphate galactosephosphotransferase [Roseibacterium elongatum DSM 19469]|uniref:Undecaprenyl-phosphate galactosephosphotransferase n=2 Tax=Roseicyclus elongatus TaxID=159346 RepID=W8RRN2_9RHOB|nr:Undecaprenyl-phosphate galactosephosphotransferase [Roseibacterium elongatum DSM 19469]
MERNTAPMTPAKRLFDLVCAILLSILLAPVIVLVAMLILVLDGRPIFYISERMRSSTQGFDLVKFRTMKPVAGDSGVSGGDKSDRITRTGAFLRRTRLDEVPQLWNVLRGDISFVGPRPPLRQYVDRFPDLYGRVLQSRPGITGLASIYFHAHEEHLLARTSSREETDAVYSRACIPRKAHLDLIYQENRTVCMDMMVMLKTVFKRLR